jgi:hypothetical protein
MRRRWADCNLAVAVRRTFYRGVVRAHGHDSDAILEAPRQALCSDVLHTVTDRGLYINLYRQKEMGC